MNSTKFTFAHMTGWVDRSGFMMWGGIHCQKSAAKGGLRLAVEAAFKTL